VQGMWGNTARCRNAIASGFWLDPDHVLAATTLNPPSPIGVNACAARAALVPARQWGEEARPLKELSSSPSTVQLQGRLRSTTEFNRSVPNAHRV